MMIQVNDGLLMTVHGSGDGLAMLRSRLYPHQSNTGLE